MPRERERERVAMYSVSQRTLLEGQSEGSPLFGDVLSVVQKHKKHKNADQGALKLLIKS